jgi:hypothetical protein
LLTQCPCQRQRNSDPTLHQRLTFFCGITAACFSIRLWDCAVPSSGRNLECADVSALLKAVRQLPDRRTPKSQRQAQHSLRALAVFAVHEDQ